MQNCYAAGKYCCKLSFNLVISCRLLQGLHRHYEPFARLRKGFVKQSLKEREDCFKNSWSIFNRVF